MLNASSSLTPWVWPLNIECYDRTPELKRQEIKVLERHLPRLEQGVQPCNVMRQAKLDRLLDPVEDVFSHVRFQRNRQPAMKILLLKEMLERRRSLWGWTEDEWFETIKKSGRDRHFVTAVAYLLCELDGLHKLGRRNFVFCCLAYRVFGRERLRALFSEVTQMLVGWGYRKRLAGTFVPRVLCELLVTNRSPKLEDLTLELLQTVERRRVSATSTWCLSVLSKVLASRGIISAPIMRMDKPKRANPELTAGVPEKWVQAAKYWYENGTRCSRLRRADYYFVLAVGRWLAAEHPTIRSPEQWDWNLAVQCLTMITNMRCGDWRAPGVAPWGWRKHYSRPLKAATKTQNYTAVRTFFGDLQEWLGHRLPSSTQRYAKITPTKLMKSYSDAGYFGRNLRAIEVLIDQEKVRAGVSAEEAWKFYDLGHGYCTYDFFDECPHRMACAKCSFYIPKESTAAALLVGKSNLLRMRQEIPLSEAELAALDDGVSALESLLSRLADVPTPAGQTPVQLRAESLVQIDAMQRRTEA